jgi:LEA14-like dessication related protein
MNRVLIPALAALAAACATAQPASGPAPDSQPAAGSVTAETLKIEDREHSISGMQAVVTVKLKNAGTDPVSAKRAHYEIVTGGKVVNSGDAQLSATVPAGGEATVEIPAPFVWAKTDDEVASYVQRKEPIEYAVRGTVELSDGKVDFAKAAAVRAPRMPTLMLMGFDVASSPTRGITVTASVDLENPNTFPLTLQGSHWKLTLGGKLANEGVLEHKAPKAASHTSYPIEATIELDEVKARKELQGSKVSYSLEAEIDLGAAKVHLEESGDTRVLRAGD